MSVLSIKDLHVAIGDKEILKGINLTINTGETHALMGPNGNGKSTLLGTIMGHPKYKVTQGTITLDGEDVLSMSVDERSRKGLFLGMQYPQEIPGVTNSDFLRSAMNARREKPLSLYQFIKAMDHATEDLEMDGNLAHRYLNEGFSGGEKKRNEILQMKLLEPKFALLDEIDSGLDVDALRIVADNINEMRETKKEDFGLVMVSHYERLYELVKPTHVHVLVDGNIVVEGGFELIEKINNEGYEWVKKELGIELQKEDEDVVSIGVCGHKVTSNV
ncbi:MULTISPECIES: Fe-S cluster assembly ATPase SufC [Catenibacterium]|jgi:Fe-S cluster assembly ATP-binding protein|uniref:Fe-S cluster assembly ATPase SufC n=1 Tax=Catenibacterium faecis TaxID=2764323 RepID=A0ABR7KCT6_9FIRM|nr:MULTISPECIES: Fe-S cluster assembly ATPase SufC [Catenibacterium]MBC6010389.1 Fe-S cluster assembly ATPase SufC [Catenibacterium faecis]MBD9122664.1 Fe-S cluster assembly ATPase SufC [Catenibacterium mitsuokai]MBD9190057.1 Fe-S cluster assembly ATPase SufC [Catenibacterium mitsuokai]MBT9815828.1 Fe-S cluster assembly ATPase SufC [Catenibacterium mitsuokai]